MRFHCYKPTHGRTLHVKTDFQNEIGKRIVDYVLKKYLSIVSCRAHPSTCADFKTSLVRLPGDNSLLPDYANTIGYDGNRPLYNHAVYASSYYHIILLSVRFDCDDWDRNKGTHRPKGSWWRFYTR